MLYGYPRGDDMAERLFDTPDNPNELPDDYEVCGTCDYDHAYDGCNPAVYQQIKTAHEAADRLERGMKRVECICTVGDPCDYHAATCIVCKGGCKGHPCRFNPEVDAADRTAEFVHNIETRVAEMASVQAHRPRYWLVDPTGTRGGRVFVLVGVQIPGDSDFPWSWMRAQDIHWGENAQLAAADAACRHLCKWASGCDTTEETSDAVWYGYEFEDRLLHQLPPYYLDRRSLLADPGGMRSPWDRIKELMLQLLGPPGKWPKS